MAIRAPDGANKETEKKRPREQQIGGETLVKREREKGTKKD